MLNFRAPVGNSEHMEGYLCKMSSCRQNCLIRYEVPYKYLIVEPHILRESQTTSGKENIIKYNCQNLIIKLKLPLS